MAKTNIPYGDPIAKVTQSVGLFAAHMQRNSTMNRLTGKMPTAKDAEGVLRKQSSATAPIVRCVDLARGDGDEITFDLINPINALPTMGDEFIEGRGVGMSFSQDRLRVNQARFAVSLGGTMTNQRSPHELRPLARAQGQSLMDRYGDQSLLVHMAGARGSHSNVDWVVPLASNAGFNKIMVNTVKAPTKNRHFISTGSGIEALKVGSGEVTITTADVFNFSVVDGIRNAVDNMALPPPPVIFEGDRAANDSPLRVLLVSPAQFAGIAQDSSFRTYQANAMARAQMAGNHPLFAGPDTLLWNGILVVKMIRPIRFYAGDTIKYCASYTSETESSAVVPSGFGTTTAVDRAILLGGQAVAEAFAKHAKTGAPMFWSEKELDHENVMEIALSTIRGVSKIRYLIDHGTEKQYTDYGVTVIDTAVTLPASA